MTSAKQQRILARAKARECLNGKGNRLLLIWGILACVLVTVALSIVVDSFYVILARDFRVTEAVALLCLGAARFLLFYFLAFPLYLGVVDAAGRISRDEQADLFVFFGFYRSLRMLGRAWRIQLRVAVAALPFFAVAALRYAIAFCPSLAWESVFSAVFTLALPLAVIGGFLSTGRVLLFVRMAVRDEGRSLRNVRKETARLARGNMRSLHLLRLRYWSAFLLSLLSIGVVTLIDTLPTSLLIGEQVLLQWEKNITTNQ